MKEQLSRFFGMSEKKDSDPNAVKSIPIERIIPNRYQPRTVFKDDKIDELCQTIKTHGVIQPIIVRESENDQFEIIAGERRWRACTKLNMETIPAIIKDFNDTQAASVALIENLQREGLTAIEEAKAYQKLIEYHHLTQESLAQRLGKGQSTVANKLRLLHLPEVCQEALNNRHITERHARALLSLKDADLQTVLLGKIIEQQLNVKQTEQLIEKELQRTPVKKKRKKRKSYSKDMRLAMNTIRESVDMVLKSGLSVETEEKDNDQYVEFTIKIPKRSS
jgi:ParB family transcriptional regulator, chromosome partitioning protein